MIQHAFSQLPDTLEETIRETLTRHLRGAGRNLRFEIEADRVVLKGEVANYYQKQLAQESVRKLGAVRDIHNEIRVRPPGPRRLQALQTAASR